MLLNIYLGTTAISWATVFIFSAACEKKLKREGYKVVKEKKSIKENIASFISIAFKGSIPIYNILNTIAILCMGDKLYEYITEEMPSSEETNTYIESIEKASTEKNMMK